MAKVESHTFAGMETAVEEQSKAAAIYTAEELTKRLIEPRPAIDAKIWRQSRENAGATCLGKRHITWPGP